MPDSVSYFLAVNAVLVILLAFYFLWPKRPAIRFKAYHFKKGQPPARPYRSMDLTSFPESFERSLTVHFNFNGHEWEAYEILGLPAGSSMESVEVAYREMMASVESESQPFVDAAYRAIKENNQN